MYKKREAKPRILVVDDTPHVLLLLSKLLEKEGYEVVTKKTARDGLDEAFANPPDLIILDIMLPGMDGYDACQFLKSRRETRDIPVIFFSGLSDGEDKVKAFQMGGIDYVTKPFQSVEILARVKTHLSLERMKRELEDKNEQLEKEIQIRERTQLFLKNILQVSLEGIAVMQPVRNKQQQVEDFCWRLVNPVVLELWGKADLQDQSFAKSTPPALFKKLLPAFDLVLRNGQPYQEEFYLEHGNVRGWYNIIVSSIGAYISVTFRNITMQKRMNMLLEKQANQDGLTQLDNRRCFDKQLQQEWRRCLFEQKPIALVLGDVDHFKLYNDTYGHTMGDDCLIQVAKAIQSVVKRPQDRAARYGGEEIAVILGSTDLLGAQHIADEILHRVQALNLAHSESPHQKVTMSLGVACCIPENATSQEILIQQADQALYRAKEQGRNCTIAFQGALFSQA